LLDVSQSLWCSSQNRYQCAIQSRTGLSWRRDKAMRVFSTVPLLGHEAVIEQDLALVDWRCCDCSSD